MGRRTVDVSTVDPDDLRDITGLWLAARVDAGSSKEAAARAVTEGRLTTALRRPGVQAFVARLDGRYPASSAAPASRSGAATNVTRSPPPMP